MAVDLHLHSNVSDGVDSPTRLMELAAEAGVTTASLTDHDTLDGLAEAKTAAERLGIRLIPGVELSVDHRGRKIHMLVYYIEPGGGPLQDRLHELLDGRSVRNVRIVAKLNELGYPITMAEVEHQASGPSVGRPHIADALIERGFFHHRNEVFEDLLRDGGAAYFPRSRLTAEEAITLARKARQVPVVAHPKTIQVPDDGYGALFRELTDLGLGGIEAHHSMHEPELRLHLTELAHSLGLAATGGSDFHGVGTRDYRIATGAGDLRVPEASVEDLELQRQS
mgnify:CR=1 FL=1